jgi:hypothetical protein
MDRSELLELMAKLKLFGMRAAYDEIMADGLKRRHEPARILGELLAAEIADKQARSPCDGRLERGGLGGIGLRGASLWGRDRALGGVLIWPLRPTA